MAKTTHCKHGHEFTSENTRIRDRGRWKERVCVTCAITRKFTPKQRVHRRDAERARRKTAAWQGESWLRRANRHGLTLVGYLALIHLQNYRCAICSCELDMAKESTKGSKRPHTDHDHATGVVRGILCNWCNVGLGMFRDRSDLMARATVYLAAHGSTGSFVETDGRFVDA